MNEPQSSSHWTLWALKTTLNWIGLDWIELNWIEIGRAISMRLKGASVGLCVWNSVKLSTWTGRHGGPTTHTQTHTDTHVHTVTHPVDAYSRISLTSSATWPFSVSHTHTPTHRRASRCIVSLMPTHCLKWFAVLRLIHPQIHSS